MRAWPGTRGEFHPKSGLAKMGENFLNTDPFEASEDSLES